MSKTIWIGPTDDLRIGDRGFLVHTQHNLRGWSHRELLDIPPMTNQSHRYRLEGWCGTTNDVAVYGEGMAEVIKLARNGRALVRELEGEPLRQALEDFGFPELTPED